MTRLEAPAAAAPPISRRGIAMPASPIRDLTPLADAAKARGTSVLHLNIGQPDLETPSCMIDRLRTLDRKILEYSPSQGTPEFLESIAKYYQSHGIDWEGVQALATTGGSEALLFAVMATSDPGDEIIIPEPFYANYRSFTTMADVGIVPVGCRLEDRFHLPPLSRWKQVLTSRTRAVILCSPNNPTGAVYTREELSHVGDFCREANLFLIVDEVYREFAYDGRRAVSALELREYDNQVVVVDSLSKRYSACGIRLGSLLTRNVELYDACLRMAQGRLSPPGLAQIAAAAMGEVCDDYFETTMAEYQRRRDLLDGALRKIDGVEVSKPEGAFYCMARLPVRDSDDFVRWLLSEFELDGETVMLAPASGFYETTGRGRDEVRIAYVLSCDQLLRAARIIEEGLRAYSVKNG